MKLKNNFKKTSIRINTNKTARNNGFTLLELLVVVAIIGLLAAVITAALNNANKKGGDAGIKSNLNNARTQAEVFYNNNTVVNLSYTNVCTNGAVGGIQGIGALVLGAAKARGFSAYSTNAVGDSSTAVCNQSANAWSAQVPLREGGFWCVDSANQSKYSASSVITTTTDYSCN